MNVVAVVCARCGAPLPVRDVVASCAYCGATMELHGNVRAHGAAVLLEDLTARRTNFVESLKTALQQGVPVYDAVRTAATTHLGALGEGDAVARVTVAMGRRFARESGADIARDPLVFSRLAEAYLKAIAELRATPQTQVNLPFLAATAEGPKHFEMTLTPAIIAALVAEDPHQAMGGAARAAVPAGDANVPTMEPKKKRFWLF